MTSVSLPRVKQAQVITGDTLINSPATSLEAVVNGALGDSNLAANSPIKLVTTLSGESVRAGKTVLLQAGASRIQVTYDSTLAKWVSDPIHIIDGHENQNIATVYPTLMSNSIIPNTWIQDFKTIYDAGLRPQFLAWALLTGPNAAQVVRAGVQLDEINDGSTGVVTLGTPELLNHNSTTATYKFANWAIPSFTAPSRSHLLVRPAFGRDTSGTGDVASYHIEIRWRST